MTDHDICAFLETYNIMTYGLRGRRVALEARRVCWIKKNGERIPINDWTAALEQAGHDETKEALIQMGAQVCDQRALSAKWIKLAKWDGKGVVRTLDGTRIVSAKLSEGRYVMVTESGVPHYGSKDVLVRLDADKEA